MAKCATLPSNVYAQAYVWVERDYSGAYDPLLIDVMVANNTVYIKYDSCSFGLKILAIPSEKFWDTNKQKD